MAKGYTVLSAPSALGLLNGPEAGGFVCVTENKDTDGIGEGWQLLMKQMVQYLQEAQDVRLAAKNAYDAACRTTAACRTRMQKPTRWPFKGNLRV